MTFSPMKIESKFTKSKSKKSLNKKPEMKKLQQSPSKYFNVMNGINDNEELQFDEPSRINTLIPKSGINK